MFAAVVLVTKHCKKLRVQSCRTTLCVAAGPCLQTNSDADNIIPDHVTVRGTLRALSHEHMMLLKQRIEEAVPAVVPAFRWVRFVKMDSLA